MLLGKKLPEIRVLTWVCIAAVGQFVGIREMADAITRLSGGAGSSAAHVQALQALPPQQQLVIIAAVRLLSAPSLLPYTVRNNDVFIVACR